MNVDFRSWYLVRLWRASTPLTVVVVLLVLAQAWCAKDGVIRFPFVHWWMYSAPFHAPDSVVLRGYRFGQPDTIENTPHADCSPPLKARESLELALARASGEGYGDRPAQAWMNGTMGRLLEEALGSERASAWKLRINPLPGSGLHLKSNEKVHEARLLNRWTQHWCHDELHVTLVDTVLYRTAQRSYEGNHRAW